MIAVTIVNLLAVLFAYLTRYRQFRYGLEVSFVIIFLFLALRYNFGNDYRGYFDSFLDINRYASIDLRYKSAGFEPGWKLLCRVFKPFGFFAMTAVLALINSFIYYRFIKKYVPLKYYWLAVFLYVFSPGLMLIHSSAMRQSLAIVLFIFSLDYLYKKDAIRYFLCIGLASLFHTSALILLPVYLLSFLNWKITKVTGVFILSIFVSIFLYAKFISFYLNQFINIYFEQYKGYGDLELIKLGTGLGVAFNVFLFLLVLYYEKFQIKDNSLIFKISILYFMVIPFLFLIQMVGRIGMYFYPVTIAVYPLIFFKMKDIKFRAIILMTIILFTMFTFFQFFQSPIWHDYFMNYQTIFSA